MLPCGIIELAYKVKGGFFMKKILSAASFVLIALTLFGCQSSAFHVHDYVWHSDETGHSKICACGALSEEASTHADADQNGYCDVCNYPFPAAIDLSEMFKTAYANSFPKDMEIDRDNIEVVEYYGMIGDSHIMSMDSCYLDDAYPNDAYIESVEDMEFRYDLSYKVYVVHEDTLFTAKAAYEKKIIDFNSLCKLFGLHTAKLDTFDAKAYQVVKATMKSQLENADSYELDRYYGEYNGFHAVSLNFLGSQAAICFEENVGHLRFQYGYESNRIRFISDSKIYTLNEAFDQGIITGEDLYNLFALHTKSESIDEALVNQLLTPAYELCLKYPDAFDREVVFDRFHLTKYYGQYGDSHIFGLFTSCWIKSDFAAATPEETEVMKYGFSDIAYVLHDGKLYTLDQALEQGIITEEIKAEIMQKYYE